MKTKEQQAEEYAMDVAKMICPSIHTLNSTKEAQKRGFLAGYNAAVKDNAELIDKIRGIVGDALATQSYPNFEMALYQLRNLLNED